MAFSRVRLDRGDGAKVRLGFRASQLAVTQASGERAVTPGTYRSWSATSASRSGSAEPPFDG